MASIEADILEMVEAHTAALEKAAAFQQEKEAEAGYVAAHIPEIVELLCQQGKIEPGQQEKCAEALRNPVQAIQLFKFALKHASEKSAGTTHLPATLVKGAGAGANGSGARRTSSEIAMEAADRVLFG